MWQAVAPQPVAVRAGQKIQGQELRGVADPVDVVVRPEAGLDLAELPHQLPARFA